MNKKRKGLFLVNQTTSVKNNLPITKGLSLEKVKALFIQESLLFGEVDGVPYDRVIELFGESALKFASKEGRITSNGYGIGGYTVHYLTWQGFKIAATYNNVIHIKALYV